MMSEKSINEWNSLLMAIIIYSSHCANLLGAVFGDAPCRLKSLWELSWLSLLNVLPLENWREKKQWKESSENLESFSCEENIFDFLITSTWHETIRKVIITRSIDETLTSELEWYSQTCYTFLCRTDECATFFFVFMKRSGKLQLNWYIYLSPIFSLRIHQS